MNPILESARQIRSEAGYACVVIRGDTTLTSGSSGIKQLLDWLLRTRTRSEGLSRRIKLSAGQPRRFLSPEARPVYGPR